MHADGNHGDHAGGFVDHHGPSHNAMSAAIHASGHSYSDHYGFGAVVFSSHGVIGGGHVINTVSNAGAHYGTAGHVDGPGANQLNPNKLRIQDVKGARLLVAHATLLDDRGCGYWAEVLDTVATRIGLKRIDSRPDKKGEDNPGLDGILPWNAWGDPNSTVRPDGWLPLLRALTDRHIHIFAIPVRGRDAGGARAWVVPPGERITVTARITAWHYAETRDAEVKIEVFVNTGYVYDPFQGGYTFFGRRSDAIEVKALELIKALFTEITADDQKADPKRRQQHVARLATLPHLKGRNQLPKHETGVHVGTSDEVAELDAEEVADMKATDRRIENTVAGGAAGTTPAPAGGGLDDDGDSLIEPLGNPAAVVAAPSAAIDPLPAEPVPTTGTFVIPKNMKK